MEQVCTQQPVNPAIFKAQSNAGHRHETPLVPSESWNVSSVPQPLRGNELDDSHPKKRINEDGTGYKLLLHACVCIA